MTRRTDANTARALARIDRMLAWCRSVRLHARPSAAPSRPDRPKPRPGDDWSPWERSYLKRMVGRRTHAQIAAVLGRTAKAVQSYAKAHRYLGPRRPWSAEELEAVRAGAAAGETPEQILAGLPGRTLTGVYQARARLGLCRNPAPSAEEAAAYDAVIREKHPLGWGDAEIAAEVTRRHPQWTRTRRFVCTRRVRLGLPQNAWSEHNRRRVAAKTREQLDRAGLPTLAALHRKVVQDRIKAMGWPEDLLWREAQILSLIWERGPQTKREICEALGMPFRGARNTLHANEPGGTYMATLMRRGLLVSFRRAVRTGRRGGNVDLYSLPLDIQRRRPADPRSVEGAA